jgi:hypothetical protein
MHYEFTPKEVNRFWSHVVRSEGVDACWLRTHALRHNGYGQYAAGGKNWRTHRFAWTVTNGPVPDDMLVCHTCHVRRCCNPAHLYVGTPKDNTADMMALGRHNRPHAVFSDDEVREIRRRVAAGELKKDVARSYGVWPTVVGRIVNGRSYRHVE